MCGAPVTKSSVVPILVPTTPTSGDNMKVWIDQDLCTGDALCSETCPDIFEMHEDGLAYVKEADWPDLYGPEGTADSPVYRMAAGQASVPDELVESVIEAADGCPGDCIFIEVG